MKTRWPGFLSPLGVWASLITLVGLGVLTWFRGPVMFSPGPLNAVAGNRAVGGISTHAELAGRCEDCHAAPWSKQTMSDRCLDCHQDVAAQVRGQTDLHGKMSAANVPLACQGCHPEHRGADASLTVLSSATFSHDLASYSLRGHERTAEGAKVTCADCHGQDLTRFDQATCTSCHTERDANWMQQHTTTFGSQCLSCHDGVDRYGADFDHNKVAFRLEGEHAEVHCAQCHTNATTIEALQQTPRNCVACHEKDDAHQGQLGQQCEQCHTASSWENVTFDHNKSAFPLTGAHAKVACNQCHQNSTFQGTPTDCISCHPEPAFHAGAFGNQSTQCATCHTADAWAPAQFSLNHDRFPINHGARGTNSCRTCHTENLQSYTCYKCHDPAKTKAEHDEEGIRDLANCVRCHAGGREEGRERDRRDD